MAYIKTVDCICLLNPLSNNSGKSNDFQFSLSTTFLNTTEGNIFMHVINDGDCAMRSKFLDKQFCIVGRSLESTALLKVSKRLALYIIYIQIFNGYIKHFIYQFF